MKKTTAVKMGALITALALGIVLAGCPTGGGGGGGGFPQTYSSGGYTLTLIDESLYTLTSSGKKSTGTYEKVSTIISLTPSKGDPTTVTISGSNGISSIGLITWDDGSTGQSVTIPGGGTGGGTEGGTGGETGYVNYAYAGKKGNIGYELDLFDSGEFYLMKGNISSDAPSNVSSGTYKKNGNTIILTPSRGSSCTVKVSNSGITSIGGITWNDGTTDTTVTLTAAGAKEIPAQSGHGDSL